MAQKKKDDPWAKRGYIVREIVEGEEEYIRRVSILVNNYRTPMERNSLLNRNDIAAIFPDALEQILPVNQHFLEDLKGTVDAAGGDYSHAEVGAVFVQFSHYFRMYTEYVDGQEQANTVLAQAKETYSVKRFLNRTAEETSLDIDDLLIEPVQRIPRYNLLLDRLLRSTPPEHPDAQTIPEAMDLIREVSERMNKAATDAANFRALQDLQAAFQNPEKTGIAIYGRQLLKQGSLTKVCRNQDKEYSFFLFDDMLVYAHGGTGISLYVLHNTLPIDSQFAVRGLDDQGAQRNRMEVNSVAKSFVVYAADPAEKDAWMEAFGRVEERVREQQRRRRDLDEKEGGAVKGAAPVWVPDVTSNKCAICGEEFNRLFKWRHHCRMCGDLVCSTCSSHTMELKNFKEPVRVCDRCFSGRSEAGKEPEVKDTPAEQEPEPEQEVAPAESELTYIITAGGAAVPPPKGKGNFRPHPPDHPPAKGTGPRRPPGPSPSQQAAAAAATAAPAAAEQGSPARPNGRKVIGGRSVFPTGSGGSAGPSTAARGAGSSRPHPLVDPRPEQKAARAADHEEEDKGSDSEEEVEHDVWYVATATVRGSPETQELGTNKGDKISVQDKDPSGYWFAVDLSTHEVGWIDPYVLTKMVLRSENQLYELEQMLRESHEVYQARKASSTDNAPTPVRRGGAVAAGGVAAAASSTDAARAQGSNGGGGGGKQRPVYRVCEAYVGDAEQDEIPLVKGEIFTILKKDPSGFWYGRSNKTRAAGWIDPSRLELI